MTSFHVFYKIHFLTVTDFVNLQIKALLVEETSCYKTGLLEMGRSERPGSNEVSAIVRKGALCVCWFTQQLAPPFHKPVYFLEYTSRT
jgi:hypothetical protein